MWKGSMLIEPGCVTWGCQPTDWSVTWLNHGYTPCLFVLISTCRSPPSDHSCILDMWSLSP